MSDGKVNNDCQDTFVSPQLINQEKKTKKIGLKSKFGKIFGVQNKTNEKIEIDEQSIKINPNNFNKSNFNPFKGNESEDKMLSIPSSNMAKADNADQKQSRVANATGSGRNKVALKPGHSIMDWIRLTNSGKDLTCGKHGQARVSGTELQKHNTAQDAWTAINGIVYNITPYIDFHPGGADELLRAAGKDSSDLFNQIHAWVNYESMLQKCCVGRLVRGPDVIKAPLNLPDIPPPSKKVSNASTTKSIKVANAFYTNAHPLYRWCDDLNTTKLIVDPKLKSKHCPPYLFSLTDEQEFILTIKLPQNFIYMVHLKLFDKVLKEQIKISYLYEEIHVELIKKESKHWPTVGTALSFDNSLISEQEKERNYYKCKLVNKTGLTHDTYLFEFELPEKCVLRIRPCEHVQVKTCDGTGSADDKQPLARYYTPIPNDLAASGCTRLDHNTIKLAIKLYEDGAMSARLRALSLATDCVLISEPIAIPVNVNNILSSKSNFYLLAAGTGITPILNVIHELHANSMQSQRYVTAKLAYFNKGIQDIIFERELQWYEQQSNSVVDHKQPGLRLQQVHMLSNTEVVACGNIKQGKVSKQFLLPWLSDISSNASNSFIFICGPSGFVVATLNILTELQLNQPTLVHVFSE